MNRRALISCVVALGVTFTSGCMFTTQALSGLDRRYRNVDFHVVDAETAKPVSGAVLHVAYQGMGGLIPDDVQGRTNRDGRVKLRVDTNNFAILSVKADGYAEAPENPELFKKAGTHTVRVYRLPQPYHVLELPTSARGVFRIEVPIVFDEQRKLRRDWGGWKPGQRELVTPLDAGSTVRLRALPAMGGDIAEQASIRGARFADGSPVPLWYPASGTEPPASPARGDTRIEGMSPQPADMVGLWLIGRDYSSPGNHLSVLYAGPLSDAVTEQQRLREQWQPSPKRRQWLPDLPPRGAGR
jgi:hypothetical protein